MRTWLGCALVTGLLVFGLPTGPSIADDSPPTSVPVIHASADSAQLSSTRRKKLNRSLKKTGPWNVVLVLTDDQPKGMLGDMPILRREIARRGVTYPNAFIPTSVCCPSRASLLTGELAQKTGVYDNSNSGLPGGYRAFKSGGNEGRTFAVALKKAGYRTGYFGKYLNEYGNSFKGWKPAGWSNWQVFTNLSRSGDYYNYPVTKPYKRAELRRISRGKRVDRPVIKQISKYSTTYFGKKTAKFIRSTPRSKPLLTVFAPYAPHGGYKASTKYRGSLTDSGWWRKDASVMEDDVSDKPLWVQQNPVTENLWGHPLGQAYRKQRETLRSVDDEIGRIIHALSARGRLKKTVFIFASDNGYAHGQHRLFKKYTPYRAPTEVPLIVRFGNKIKRSLSDKSTTAANVDLTATILRAAGLSENVYGRPVTSKKPRKGVPLTGVEYWGGVGKRPPYCGWRNPNELYVRYGSGEEEYYNYRSDPLELRNRADDPNATGRVKKLRKTAAKYCRPAPPGFGTSFYKPTWKYPSDAVPAATPKTAADVLEPTPTASTPTTAADVLEPTPTASTPTTAANVLEPTPTAPGPSEGGSTTPKEPSPSSE